MFENTIKPNETLLPYQEFVKLTNSKSLNSVSQEWLNEWNSFDLATSPTVDEDRKLIRYGHYVGFMQGRNYG